MIATGVCYLGSILPHTSRGNVPFPRLLKSEYRDSINVSFKSMQSPNMCPIYTAALTFQPRRRSCCFRATCRRYSAILPNLFYNVAKLMTIDDRVIQRGKRCNNLQHDALYSLYPRCLYAAIRAAACSFSFIFL